ncbi:hypothetical protein A3G55_01310 [Candidatus Giovannonibacteria bacterium RIFCSPLOWO2_12_FULL_44_25]|uniref:Type II secretion system protein GspF domain-containing protein n=1 Tax=Candidatus Giovannonibacteria bacterium RIFCSPHIGHO2_02_FULL_45_40 TaxID=1798337 RepID=A0A1F5W905_9BACT|nr:MAG: hypothetical protein UX43_C0003G0028 [Candidatus Giovannonibacteria bacterium GW2011_GWB1_46_20]OGF59755.1 MAG: hypothetical protein A2W40_01435 [Candidatus Giovannonibacteria bacterium RIFCSPHIGHO2_01_45_12]OGF60961.1 MAG: hypothetical protein A2656_01760 [Candidatus Giovannonibacteria bacterium RIFCSPHIGHO2_01_FULL_44_100]OGF72136.1 MAG: hypothetical protein A3C05_02830 [Candidatus Giovannonibacteria bacterium RIFCSPHIGHO2_02_FULL_45_40]OGF84527.1 MAG: hypothetical protein A3A19_00145
MRSNNEIQKNSDNLYIALIKYGKEKLTEGVNYKEAQEHLTKIGFDFKNPQISHLFRDAFLHIFGTEQEKVNGFYPGVEHKKFLGVEAYFNLLDHEELQHARQSSAEAKKLAITAIWISAGLAFFSILLSIIQIWHTSEIEITETQFNQLKLK